MFKACLRLGIVFSRLTFSYWIFWIATVWKKIGEKEHKCKNASQIFSQITRRLLQLSTEHQISAEMFGKFSKRPYFKPMFFHVIGIGKSSFRIIQMISNSRKTSSRTSENCQNSFCFNLASTLISRKIDKNMAISFQSFISPPIIVFKCTLVRLGVAATCWGEKMPVKLITESSLKKLLMCLQWWPAVFLSWDSNLATRCSVIERRLFLWNVKFCKVPLFSSYFFAEGLEKNYIDTNKTSPWIPEKIVNKKDNLSVSYILFGFRNFLLIEKKIAVLIWGRNHCRD